MLTLYKYMVDNGMLDFSEVPEPYNRMMRREGYGEPEIEEEAE